MPGTRLMKIPEDGEIANNQIIISNNCNWTLQVRDKQIRIKQKDIPVMTHDNIILNQLIAIFPRYVFGLLAKEYHRG